MFGGASVAPGYYAGCKWPIKMFIVALKVQTPMESSQEIIYGRWL